MEKHIALYRKYRPQNYSDIFSQDIVSEILKNSIKNNRLSHAYIFFGTRGVGKTTIARIFAKAINCENNINGEPCNVCYSCSIFNTNNNVDVIELDAASNNGVEEIRKLINNSKHAPTNMKNKVFIIDEAHMLTSNAWNAFLKTLEEPQPNVVFILATTEFHKLPETIISRCIKISFQRMTDQKIKEIILSVSSKEGCSLDNESVDILVKIANGSARDALSALEQVITLSPNINSDSLTEIFGYYSDVKVKMIYEKLSSPLTNLDQILNILNDSTNFFKLAEDIIRIASSKDFKLVRNIINHFSILKENQYSREIFLAVLNMSIDLNRESEDQNSRTEIELNNKNQDLNSIHVDSRHFVAKIISDEKYNNHPTIDLETNKLKDNNETTEKSIDKRIQKNNLDSEIINIMLLNQENVRTELKRIKDDFIINNGVNSKTDELLRKSKIIWASQEFAIFLFDSTKDVNNFNSISTHSEKLKKLFGDKIFFFAVSKYDAKRLTKMMLENKPNPKPFKRFIINIDNNVSDDVDPMALAKEIFS